MINRRERRSLGIRQPLVGPHDTIIPRFARRHLEVSDRPKTRRERKALSKIKRIIERTGL